MAEYGLTLVGAAVWSTALALLRPQPFDLAWAHALLMLAPLVLVPLGLRTIAAHAALGEPEWLWRIVVIVQLPAALVLGAGFLLPQGFLAATLSGPYLMTTGLLAVLGLVRLWHHRRDLLRELCVDAGLVYIAIGGLWASADRWGLRPLNFEPAIVLLTAIHFHYAGFVLPLLTGLATRREEERLSRLASVAVVVAVPLVAAGITATQLDFGPFLECVSAWFLAFAAAWTAYLYFRLSRQPAWPSLVRALWAVSAISLTGSMVLAILYGSRHYLATAWLDIPWMRALHGTANALGFALAGLLGWTRVGQPSITPR